MTGDEMQRAIEFLLKTQANFESRFELQTEETNRQIAHTNQIVETLAETQTEFTQTVLGFITSQNAINESFQKSIESFQKSNESFQKSNESFQKSIESFQKSIDSLQKLSRSFRKELDELAQAQKRTEQAILDLTRTVNNFISFTSGNGNSPRE